MSVYLHQLRVTCMPRLLCVWADHAAEGLIVGGLLMPAVLAEACLGDLRSQ